jgi:hypothetical protein
MNIEVTNLSAKHFRAAVLPFNDILFSGYLIGDSYSQRWHVHFAYLFSTLENAIC